LTGKIEVSQLTKVFGRTPRSVDAALKLLALGETKDEIMARTGAVIAVADVSLSVGEGEIYMVMGLSGSGKSTLVRCLNRLIEPTSGTVHIDGENVFDKDVRELRGMRRTRMSMVFQNFALLPHKTVVENVEFGLKVRGEEKASRFERAMETIDLVGLAGWEHHYPDNLSGGMQQRLGLARALANDPDILLMDEPFSALDPLIRNDMQNELVELQGRLRKTIVFITHDFQEAIKLGDHIAIMKDGVIVQVGGPAELVSRPADDYVVNFTSEIDRGRVFTAQSVMRTAENAVGEECTCSVASRAFNGSGRDCVFVLNGVGQPVGYVREGDMGNRDGGSDRPVSKAMATEFPRISPDHRLAEIYTYCDTDAPLAVVDDDDGRFLGYVSARDILVQLAATRTTAPEPETATMAAEPDHE
jgi:glycine betaine/proline transport system ATP-binding protein